MRDDRPRRILCLFPYAIGDAVMATGVLRHFRASARPALFTIIASPITVPLFRAFPDVERVIPIEKRALHLHWIALWRHVVGTHWDVVVDLRASGIAYGLRARRRIVGRLHSDQAPVHRVVRAAALIGVEADPPAPLLVETEASAAAAERMLGGRAPVLALAPGGSKSFKLWPSERFAAFAAEALGPGGLLPGGRLLVLGSEAERELAEPILRALPPERVVDALGLDLVASFSCLKRVRLFVGNDSAMMHMAAAAGAPTVGLFGPTPPVLYAPWSARSAVVRGPDAYRRFLAGETAVGLQTMQAIAVADVTAFSRHLLAA